MACIGIAQSFLESVNAPGASPETAQRSPTLDGLSPFDVGVCECHCRCGKGAKLHRNVTKRSRSHTNLRTGISEVYGDRHGALLTPLEARPVQKKSYGAGESLLEQLPSEVLGESIHVGLISGTIHLPRRCQMILLQTLR